MDKQNQEKSANDYLGQFGGDKEAAIAFLMRMPKERKQKTPINNNPVLVRIENISKHYKVGRQQVEAVKNVSLEIREGEFVALTGPSGSGKSTLLQLIGGLDKPSEGKIIVGGQDISRLSDRRLSNFRNQTIGFVFQFFYLQPFLNLRTNLEVPGMFARTKPSSRHQQAEKLAGQVGLAERLKHRPKELSGGQMQRAAIARALLNNPKVILADEPTGNLDSVNGKAIIDLFDQVRREFGTTIIIVTHDPSIAKAVDREIALTDGQISGGRA